MAVNQEWLDSLQPGDEIVIESRHSSDLRRVERRSPTGRIYVNYGNFTMEFNPDGRRRGGDRYYHTHLVEPTQALRDKIERATLIDRIGRAKLTDVSLETLRQIDALLRRVSSN